MGLLSFLRGLFNGGQQLAPPLRIRDDWVAPEDRERERFQEKAARESAPAPQAIELEIRLEDLWPEERLDLEIRDAESHPGLWHIELAGHTHETRGGIQRRLVFPRLHPGQSLRMQREPDSPYDFNCVSLWARMDSGEEVDVWIHSEVLVENVRDAHR